MRRDYDDIDIEEYYNNNTTKKFAILILVIAVLAITVYNQHQDIKQLEQRIQYLEEYKENIDNILKRIF